MGEGTKNGCAGEPAVHQSSWPLSTEPGRTPASWISTHPPSATSPPTDGRPFPQYPGGSLADGSYQPPSRNAGPRNVQKLPQPQFSGVPAGTASVRSNPFDDPDYRKQLQVIYGATSGRSPESVPTWVTMIAGGSLQGAQVEIK